MTREKFIKAYARCHGVTIEEATRIANLVEAGKKGPVAAMAGKVGNAIGLGILIPVYALGAIVAIRIVLAALGII